MESLVEETFGDISTNAKFNTKDCFGYTELSFGSLGMLIRFKNEDDYYVNHDLVIHSESLPEDLIEFMELWPEHFMHLTLNRAPTPAEYFHISKSKWLNLFLASREQIFDPLFANELSVEMYPFEDLSFVHTNVVIIRVGVDEPSTFHRHKYCRLLIDNSIRAHHEVIVRENYTNAAILSTADRLPTADFIHSNPIIEKTPPGCQRFIHCHWANVISCYADMELIPRVSTNKR